MGIGMLPRFCNDLVLHRPTISSLLFDLSVAFVNDRVSTNSIAIKSSEPRNRFDIVGWG